MKHLYLSRRNLQTLLAKLDKVKTGEISACSIVKFDTVHAKYPCTEQTMITALEDEEYYTDREPGVVVEDLAKSLN